MSVRSCSIGRCGRVTASPLQARKVGRRKGEVE